MRFVCFLVGSGSLIGMMLVVRKLLRSRISPGILYALWLVPAVRLLFPFTLVPVPVLPNAAATDRVFDESDEEAAAEKVNIVDTIQSTETVGNSEITEAVFRTDNREYIQGEPRGKRILNLPCIWLSGSILCAGYVILINRRLKQRIKQMQRLPEERLVPGYIRNEAVSPCL
ncbi:MAG: M56 family metallopeptidase, partial [Lachnospiraceae bacterium]|nr:M56 family metallopeptidase [Lachnospiraceae bacterium]